jgi:uncharacterized iron-regulated protein
LTGVIRTVLVLLLAAGLSMFPHAGSEASYQPRPGFIWDVAAGKPISRAAMGERLAEADIILLGEKHDNARHHELQAEILNTLVSRGQARALVWEMLPRPVQSDIDAFLLSGSRNADRFADAVGWAKLGWGEWSLFRPIAAAALAGALPQHAGGLERSSLKAIGREGLTALPKDLAKRMPNGEILSGDQRMIIEDAVFEGHCGYVPRAHLGPMVSVQIARDLALADAIIGAVGPKSKSEGVVVIAGSQHVRRDGGVPVHLARLLPGASILSIRFVEIGTGPAIMDQAGMATLAGSDAHDILWFTELGPDKDYCGDLAKRFGLKGKPAHQKPKSD